MSEAEQSQIDEVGTLVEQARLIFAGKPPEIQGAALADLLAIWIAGHHDRDGVHKTVRLRERLLRHHLISVHKLIDYYNSRGENYE